MTRKPLPAGVLAGILWMVVSTLAMVGVNGVVKHLGTQIPAAQSAFIRFLVGVVFFLPMVPPVLRARYPARIWGLFGLRGVGHVIAVLLWFYAMARVPVAEMSAIGFINPVLVLVIGGLLLGERLGPRRFAVALVAFLGAMVVLRPGLRELSPGHWAQIGATCMFAVTYIVAKRLSAELPAGVIVATLTFTVTLGLFPLALAVWQPVTAVQVLWLAGAAGFATLGHYAMTRAFALAPLAATQPVGFLQIIWASLLGAIAFHEAVDPWVLAGGALIVGAVSVNTLAEARLAARPGTQMDPPGPEL
ncbi:DMT family transporter [Pseudogemmobacter sonorensis]|uniref:DMT family transporter n=1 Tax=Pseudogemmobacter sonorensis TaxID=2989681 RepID=UPI0036906A55